MKFGANTFIWTAPFGTDTLPLLKKVKDMGFDSIEIPPADVNLIDIEKVRSELEALELEVSILCASGPDQDISSEDPNIQQAGLDFIKLCINVASGLGSKYVAGPIYASVGALRPYSPVERKQQWSRSAENLYELAEFAKSNGIVLAIEPINRFETDLINTADQAIEMLEQVDHQNLRLQLDTFHLNIEDKNIGESIRKGGKFLVHFHACENDRGILGTGNIPWIEVKEALIEVGYNNSLVIESFTVEAKEIAKAACIWRPLAESQDAIAVEGLSFLKRLFS